MITLSARARRSRGSASADTRSRQTASPLRDGESTGSGATIMQAAVSIRGLSSLGGSLCAFLSSWESPDGRRPWPSCRYYATCCKPARAQTVASDAWTHAMTLAPRLRAAVGGSRSIMDAPRLLGLSWIVALGAHAGSGGGLGRRSSIRRRMLANSARGTATSASWNTT